MFGPIALALIALLLQYVSSTLGMGYGTMLAPLLIVAGFPVREVVPAVVMSQLVGNSLLPFLHHRVGNVDFGVRSRSTREALYLGFGGGVGGFIAAALIPEVPEPFLEAYMASLLTLLGSLVVNGFRGCGKGLSTGLGGLTILSLIASFNKGLTGGGFGPLITAGQMMLGHGVKRAVAVTSLAEFVAGCAASAVYLGAGLVNASLTYPLALGAVIAAPLSTLTVKVAGSAQLRKGVGYGMVAAGLILSIKILMSY